MTPMQTELVRRSFAELAPDSALVAELFYHHLFELDPSLKSLFKNDLKHQGERLMQMIAGAVSMLDRPAVLLPVLRQLGARHGGYGVQSQHYDTVGAALLKTLAVGLGPSFDDATRAAWTAMYSLVATTMQEPAAMPAAA